MSHSSTYPIFGHIQTLSPAGVFMFWANEKRAKWYLSRNLAKKINDKCIQLTIEPNGPGCLDRYRSQKIENICVICGSDKNLSLHHVVPYKYRKHICKYYPEYERDNHDCLCCCIKCHKKYESHYAIKLVSLLASLYAVSPEGVCKYGRWNDFLAVYKSLYNLIRLKDKIPEDRVVELRKKVEHFKTSLTKKIEEIPELEEKFILKQIDKVNRIYTNFKSPTTSGSGAKARKTVKHEIHRHVQKYVGYTSHGKSVINKVIELNQADGFVQMWRKHFLETMQPLFLPSFWEVERPVFKTRQELDDYR